MRNNSGFRERRTLFHSFADAFRGIGDCLKMERNMRVHLTVCLYVLFFAFRMGLSRGEMACLAVTIGAVMAAEAMNTAVEKLCDFNQKRLNPRIRTVKDVAAGAVLLSALAAVLVGAFLLFRPELLDVFRGLVASPVSLTLFLLSLVIAWIFVFVGPMKLRDKLSLLTKNSKKS